MTFQPFKLQPLLTDLTLECHPAGPSRGSPLSAHQRTRSTHNTPSPQAVGGTAAAGGPDSISSSPVARSSTQVTPPLQVGSPGNRAARLLSEMAARTSFRRHSSAVSQETLSVATGTSSVTASPALSTSPLSLSHNGSSPPGYSPGRDRRGPRLECVECWESNVYLGTSDGQVYHYWSENLQLTPASPDGQSPEAISPVLIQRIAVGSGKGRVEDLRVLAAVKKLLVFCESTISYYSLPDLAPVTATSFTPLRGVLCFGVDQGRGSTFQQSPAVDVEPHLTLYVAKRRTIQVLTVTFRTVTIRQEIPFATGVLRLCAWQELLCVADPQSYSLLDLRRPHDVYPVMPTNLSPDAWQRPLIVAIQCNEFLIITPSGVNGSALGVFVSSTGDAVRGTLALDSYPRAVQVVYPYVVALARTNVVEVYSVIDQRLVQVVDIPAEANSRTISSVHCLTIQAPLLWKLEGTVATSPLSPSTTVLTEKHTLNVPLVLCCAHEMYALVLQPLLLQVDALLDNQRVEEALAKIDTAIQNHYDSPTAGLELRYIYQRAGLIYFRKTLYDEALRLFQQGRIHPRTLVQFFPELVPLVPVGTSPASADVTPAETDGPLGAIDNMISNHLPSRGNRDDDDDDDDPVARETFIATLRRNAYHMVIRYLEFVNEDFRQSPDAWLHGGKEDMMVANTILLVHYLKTRSDKMYSVLMSGGQYCQWEVCEPRLIEMHKYYALFKLYQAHGLDDRALEMGTKLLDGTYQDSKFPGVQEVFNYLLALNQSALTLRYAPSVVRCSESLGAKLYVAVTTDQTPRVTVDDIVKQLQPHGPAGMVVYLEHVVYQLHSTVTAYHDQLVNAYLTQLHQRIEESEAEPATAYDQLHHTYRQLCHREGPVSFSTFLQSQEHLPLAYTRNKLAKLLLTSDHYTVPQTLERVQGEPGLDSECAILYGKLGEHEKVIKTLVLKVQDYVSAEIYCQGLAQDADRSHYFLTLLKYYLRLTDEDTAGLLVNNLLNRYGSSLDPLQVVPLVPETWSVDQLEPFLLDTFQRLEHQRRATQIVKSLSNAENLTVSNDEMVISMLIILVATFSTLFVL
ncbi:hypothetical protein IWQ61_007547 [Dispira simplex]|nr:hypothetical protein IWQ61_007547 [Dispira simplex]